MTETPLIRERGEGRTMLIGEHEYITYKAGSDETGRAYFAFELSATPGFGPPLHAHEYREFFCSSSSTCPPRSRSSSRSSAFPSPGSGTSRTPSSRRIRPRWARRSSGTASASSARPSPPDGSAKIGP
jgi:hypothetical protein